MGFVNLFGKESYPEVRKTFNTHELIHLADKALEEEPNNKSIRAIRKRLLKKLEAEHKRKELIKDTNDFLDGRL